MLLFAHLGITLGSALSINQIYRRTHKNLNAKFKNQTGYRVDPHDFLACAIGSLLPDIIDKPIGHFFLAQTFGYNGHIFAHTLLFALLILAFGIYVIIIKKQAWGLYLAFGVFAHLILDFMWQAPSTLFWPYFGWAFPRMTEYDWLGSLWQALIHNPVVYIPEIFGVLVTGFVILIFLRIKCFRLLSRDSSTKLQEHSTESLLNKTTRKVDW